MTLLRTHPALAAAVGAVISLAVPLHAEEWPSRSMTMVAPFAAAAETVVITAARMLDVEKGAIVSMAVAAAVGVILFIRMFGADRGVGKHRHGARLHLEDATRHEHELFLAIVHALDAHRTGLDAGDQRGMVGIDTKLTDLTGQHDEFGFPGKDRLLGADHFDLNRVHDVWVLAGQVGRCG